MATKQKIIITGIEDGVVWQAVSNQEWLKITDIVATALEDSFNVSADPNGASEVRTGIVTVIPSDNGTNGLVNVSQQGAVIYTLSISPTVKSSPAAGETFVITVTSNTSWTVSLPGWCTADGAGGTGNGAINVTVAANTGGQRTGNVTVAAGTLTATCAVTQAAAATDRMFHSRLYMNDYLTSSIRFDITIMVQTQNAYYEWTHFVVFNNSTLDEEWVDTIPSSDQSMITGIEVNMNTRSYTGGVYADMWSDSNFLTDTDVMPGSLSWSGNIPGNSVDFIATYSNF